ncbi:MAG: zinc ribbon domain-containing protein [Nitrospirota bacterium]
MNSSLGIRRSVAISGLRTYNTIRHVRRGMATMPIFEYICQECNHRFEAIVQGSTAPACPSCKATTLKKQLSAFAVGGTSAWSSSSGPGPCGTCGDPRGPGSCSMN